MWNEDGFGAMIINVLKNPALLLKSLLSVPEKVEFILYMFIPLCFMPFASRKLHFIFLLIAMIIMNLATDYIYQYDIDFQYTFGVTALLFFISLKNLSKLNRKHFTKICVAAACFSCILFMSKQFNKIHSYNFIYSNFSEHYVEMDKILAEIPEEASVTANAFIPPHLPYHEKVYMEDLYAETFFSHNTDYIVTDLRGVELEEYKYALEDLSARGYVKVNSGINIEVFKKDTPETDNWIY
jgi:uncharacterized membrane protein